MTLRIRAQELRDDLANRLNYSNPFSDRGTPSVGRTFLGNVSFIY